MRSLFILLLMLLPLSGFAEPAEWTSRDANGQTEVHLYFFWSRSCPHCLEARPQIVELVSRHRWIRLHEHELTASRAHIERFVELAAAAGSEARSVPSLIYCGKMETGWDDSPDAVAAFMGRLRQCRAGQSGQGALVAEHLSLPLFGEMDPAKLSLPLLTVLIAGLDAFNPCAFFVLLFLLSLLAHQQSRRRMLLIGGVFVTFSGLMYFAFMAAWLNLFLLIGSLPWVTALAGLLALSMGLVNVKDFVHFHQGPSLSIPESRKADIFQRARRVLSAESTLAMLAATVVLAIAANFYELLCTAGFPMVFTRLLTLQVPDAGTRYLYLALYNLIYVLPLLVIVLTFVRTMGSRKLSEREGRLLKLLSGLMMLGLGVLLLLAPDKLSHVGLSLAIPAVAVGLTWLASRRVPP